MIKDGDTLSIMTNMFAMVIFKRLLLSKVDSKKKIVIIERQINFVVTAQANAKIAISVGF